MMLTDCKHGTSFLNMFWSILFTFRHCRKKHFHSGPIRHIMPLSFSIWLCGVPALNLPARHCFGHKGILRSPHACFLHLLPSSSSSFFSSSERHCPLLSQMISSFSSPSGELLLPLGRKRVTRRVRDLSTTQLPPSASFPFHCRCHWTKMSANCCIKEHKSSADSLFHHTRQHHNTTSLSIISFLRRLIKDSLLQLLFIASVTLNRLMWGKIQ